MDTQPTQAELVEQMKALQDRIAALEVQPFVQPVEKTDGLTFAQATAFLQKGRRVTRASAPWRKHGWLVDFGALPHWGFSLDGAQPVIWPNPNSGAQAYQLKMDLAAQDWMVLD